VSLRGKWDPADALIVMGALAVPALFCALVLLGGCATESSIRTKTAASEQLQVKVGTAAVEGEKSTTKTDRKKTRRTVWLQPDGKTPAAIRTEEDGESSLVDTNNWKLLNSSIDMQRQAEAKSDVETKKRTRPWWHVLLVVLVVALAAGVAGLTIYRRLRPRFLL